MEVIAIANFFRRLFTHLSFTLTVIVFIFFIKSPSLSRAESKNNTPKYVGSSVCKGCHEEEYKNFTTYAKKSRSFESIERVRKELTEEEIKGCYQCHTTGYGKLGGFISPEKTPYLKNAGC